MPVKEMEVHHDPCAVPGMHTTLINIFFIPHLFFFSIDSLETSLMSPSAMELGLLELSLIKVGRKVP